MNSKSLWKTNIMLGIIIIILIVIRCSLAHACSYDTDCEVGSKCTKEGYQPYGVCTNSTYSTGNRDSGPRYGLGSHAGEICAFRSDCSPGARCIKEHTYDVTGTCSN